MKTPVGNDGDEAFLAAHLCGDDRSFDVLEADLHALLLRMARRQAPRLSADLHEEIVQEVWLAISRKREIGVEYDPESVTALAFAASFVPNAAQRIKAAYRPPGTRSRATLAFSGAGAIAPRSGWDRSLPTSLDELTDSDSVLATTSEGVLDARLDIQLVTEKAEPRVAAAIALVLESHTTLSQAAAAVGLSATTFSRRLAELGQQAA